MGKVSCGGEGGVLEARAKRGLVDDGGSDLGTEELAQVALLFQEPDHLVELA